MENKKRTLAETVIDSLIIIAIIAIAVVTFIIGK